MNPVAKKRGGREGDPQLARFNGHLFQKRPNLRQGRVGRADIASGRGIEQGSAVPHRSGEGEVYHKSPPKLTKIRTGGIAAAGRLQAE